MGNTLYCEWGMPINTPFVSVRQKAQNKGLSGKWLMAAIFQIA